MPPPRDARLPTPLWGLAYPVGVLFTTECSLHAPSVVPEWPFASQGSPTVRSLLAAQDEHIVYYVNLAWQKNNPSRTAMRLSKTCNVRSAYPLLLQGAGQNSKTRLGPAPGRDLSAAIAEPLPRLVMS